MKKWLEITQEEFKPLESFMKSHISGFGIYSSFTDTSNNYAETVFGVTDQPLLRTEHINGVSELPLFYKRVSADEL